MALIGTLRSKMGTWVVVFVFVAIISFILSDLLGNNSVLFNNNSVGEIAGTSIDADEYQQAVQEREANYILNFNRKPGDREMTTLRQQAWEMLILRHAIQKQFEEVGVAVTTDEVQDMIWGKNVDENLRSTPLFQNPSTGEFDKNRVIQYLKDIKNPPADPQAAAMWQEQRTRWEIFQRDLAPGRQRLKYENLLIKSNYVTEAEAEREYHNQTDVAEIKYLYVPYFAVSDSAAELTDADYKAYYEKNKGRYKTKETRDVQFVVFPVAASKEDSAAVVNELKRVATELAQVQDDSAYAASNTEQGAEPFVKYNAGNLPSFVNTADLKQGNVVGPFLDGGSYKVMKVSSISKDTVFSARASHILIKWDNETAEAKKAAKEKARDIIKKIKGGASFSSMALEHGTDGTATKGGDLGWFSSGTMVKPFQDAVFGATKTGLLNDVVETQYGYHIISVTNTKENTAYELAVVERAITPSDETISSTYRKAESFQLDLKGVEEFNARAKSEGLAVQEAKGLAPGDFRVGALGNARQVVAWLYRDSEEGKVSPVFDQREEYVVAVMTNETEEGYRSLESVKNEITAEVRKEVKSRVIIEQLKKSNGTLEEMANTFGKDANVYSSSDLKLSQSSLPSAGFDPVAVGVAFGLESGKRSEPFKGENGVLVVEAQNITIAPAVGDYTAYKAPIQQNMQSRSSFNIAEAIKENANIQDERYKFN